VAAAKVGAYSESELDAILSRLVPNAGEKTKNSA